MPGRIASSGSIPRLGNYSATSASLRCAVAVSSDLQAQTSNPQNSNRYTKLLEIAVTLTKQRRESSSNRYK